MKPFTQVFKSNFFNYHKFKIQSLQLCSKKFSSLCSWWVQLRFLAGVLSPKKFNLQKMIALVFKEVHAGAVALGKSCIAKINRRVVVGLAVMLIASPLAYFSYDLFDRKAIIIGWYHHNYWHLFFLIRYQIAQIVFLIGLYLFLPKEPRVKFISVYHGFLFMGLALNVVAESNADIWDTFDVYLWIAGVVFSLTIYFSLDWLASRKFHGEDRYVAREKGLYQIGFEVPAEKFRSMVMETWRNKFELNSK